MGGGGGGIRVGGLCFDSANSFNRKDSEEGLVESFKCVKLTETM